MLKFKFVQPDVKEQAANLKRQKRTASGSQLRTVLYEQAAVILTHVDEVMVALPENNVASKNAGRCMPEQFGECSGGFHGSIFGDMPKTRLSGMESLEEIKNIVNQVSGKSLHIMVLLLAPYI